MNEKVLARLMYGLLLAGVGLVLTGVGLVVFSDIVTKQGVHGIALIAGLIAGGLFLSIPAKLYLTYQLMRHNDERRQALKQSQR
ncbi:hypothetical protein [uncultured Thiothrix sp.]|jgi:membrane-bound ClpP family serine protease|uniref:hypothetical protein n=1 Tax=uncultured Thiothrix sp. TaxID=223185 RepID=UPI0026248353|nr:hypothetical protein [uncultured Thiothrix sp.]HMT93680.1 hypothetical protein [Thiolinea sp.]